MKRIFCLLVAIAGLASITNKSQAQSNGYSVFDDTYLHTIEVTFYEPNFWDTLEQYYDDLYDGSGDLILGYDKQYLPCTIVIDSTTIDSVGMRLKGYFSNWGSSSQKKPFKIDFNEFVTGQKYDGLKKLNLGNAFSDPTMLRDKLSLDMMRDAGMIAARCSHAKLYINGEYWGVYNMIEQYDSEFLEMNFPQSDTGNLYKNMNNSDMEWEGSNPMAYQDQFEKKTNEIEDDWTDFVHLIDVMNNEPQATYKDSIEANMDMHVFYTCLAVDRFLNNWDSYMDHGRNWYMYNDPAKGTFHWLPWDYNLSFDSQNFGILRSGGWAQEDKPIIDESLQDNDLKNQYFSIVCTLLHNVVDVNEFNARVDSLASIIRQAVYDDTKKESSNGDFDTNLNSSVSAGWSTLPGLKPMVASKKNAWISELAQEGFPCAVGIMESQAELFIQLFPNPSTGIVNINLSGSFEGDVQLTVMNMNGSVVAESTAERGGNFIDLSSHAKGIYFVQLTGDKIHRVEKLVVY